MRVKAEFLKQVARMVQLCDIPDSLFINLDQTGVKLVLTDDWTMAALGSRWVEVIGLGDKQQITATFAASLDRTFLPMQFFCTRGKRIVHTRNTHFQMDSTFSTQSITGLMKKRLRFFQKIVFPYVKKVREEIGAPSQKAMVLMDNFSGKTTTSLLEKLEEKGVVVIMFPAGTTDRLQPLAPRKLQKNF